MITEKNLKVSVIIAAAGRGERAGFAFNKLLAPLYGQPALWHTLKKFDFPLIDEVIIASSKEDFEVIKKLAKPFGFKVVAGGATRTESVKKALSSVTGDMVLIHDGARPFVTQKLIQDCAESVVRFGSGVCAVTSVDTVCTANYGLITSVADRNAVYNIQTPQGFWTADIKRAYELAGGEKFTDDSSVYCKYCRFPRLVEGDINNKKLTFADDFALSLPMPLPQEGARVGFGMDVHAFGEGNFVTLGGERIDCENSLISHSDGDAVFHAVTDALLSAAGLNDIGHYFPDSDEKFKGADSAKLCKEALKEVKKAGFAPVNISVSVQAERPRLAPHIENMKKNIANALEIGADGVGVSAGTCEGLGFVGEGLGIAAYACILLKKI